MRYILFLFALFPVWIFSGLNLLSDKVHYPMTCDPIDVVIPCADKDTETLEMCIEGIRQNGKNIRRIIVVSPRQLTDKAEWFDEAEYPFSKYDLALQIFGNEKGARLYLLKTSRIGWIYQQFLKLYAPFVIPDISPNVLMLDADTIFLNPVEFLTPFGEGLYNTGSEHVPAYFVHAEKLLPGFKRVYPSYSGICHHMLFQKSVLEDLFNTISSYHKVEPWKALCKCVDQGEIRASCMSEYEIYFNFIFTKSEQVKLRELKWTNVSSLDEIALYKERGYTYVSCHAYLRQ